MFIRAREFFAPRENDFSAAGMARQLFTQLKAVIAELDSLVAAQASGVGQARQRTQTRAMPASRCGKIYKRSIVRLGPWVGPSSFPCLRSAMTGT